MLGNTPGVTRHAGAAVGRLSVGAREPDRLQNHPSGAIPDGTSSPVTVYYDGACPLCTREISHYRRLDREGRVQFLDVATARPDIAHDLSRDAALARFHVRREDGELVSGAAGFIELWRHLPGWRWASRIARLPGLALALEAAYRVFLPARPFIVRVLERPVRPTKRRPS